MFRKSSVDQVYKRRNLAQKGELQCSYAFTTQDLVTFAKLQRELFRKIIQKRENLAKVTRCLRSKSVGTL